MGEQAIWERAVAWIERDLGSMRMLTVEGQQMEGVLGRKSWILTLEVCADEESVCMLGSPHVASQWKSEVGSSWNFWVKKR